MERVTGRALKEALVARYGPEALELARTLGPPDRARRRTLNAFARAFARWDHRRDESVFEMSLLADLAARSGRIGRTSRAKASDAARLLAGWGFAPSAVADITGLGGRQVQSALEAAEDGSAPAGSAGHDPATGDARVTTFDRDFAQRAIRRSVTWTALTAIFLAGLTAAGTILVGNRAQEPVPSALGNAPLPRVLSGGFDPVGPKVIAMEGTHADYDFKVSVYPAEQRNFCIELRAGGTFGDVHCLSDSDPEFRAFVAADGRHDVTFVYGYARDDVRELTLGEKGGAPITVIIEDAPRAVPQRAPRRFFLVTLPDYLLELGSRQEGERLGYRVYDVVLRATTSGGDVTKGRLVLGRPN